MDNKNFLRDFKFGRYYSLAALEEEGFGKVSRLPVSIRIVLESLLRNAGTTGVDMEDVKRLAGWRPDNKPDSEIPFKVARVILQDFTGVPLVVDLAAMRQAAADKGADPAKIEPSVPVDLVIDHSVQVDKFGTPTSFNENIEIEFHRNTERYKFLKWGQQAFKTFGVTPPGIGIVHQVNLEHLARVVFEGDDGIFYPDTLVGTDSHTTMVNGLGVVGWGVGGIEAEAGMLAQPVYFLTPEVVGVHMTGKLREGVTATDLTLRVTQLLREAKVVEKFVEFFGEGAASLPLADRATIANMAPEYGATMGYFPIDEKSLDYLRMTGREEKQIEKIEEYYKAQGIFGIPREGEVDYTQVIELDLGTVNPSVAGPKRPQDRIELPELKQKWNELMQAPVPDGFGVGEQPAKAPSHKKNLPDHGDVVIAAITSCTNTSNPYVMVAAGLLAKKAVEKGLQAPEYVKTSLAPGSRVVTDYLAAADLQEPLNKLGFNLVGYGCTTCIGNAGPLPEHIENAVNQNNLVVASVLSGNRNFEARIHSAVKANFLMSPPLVVAYALAGKVDIDWEREPLGLDEGGTPILLADIWPTQEEVAKVVRESLSADLFKQRYSDVSQENWNAIESPSGELYAWDEQSTYIQRPPFFEIAQDAVQPIKDARILAVFGDSVTTDHISPAGSIGKTTPAGKFLNEAGVEWADYNSYGSRRGNDRIMTRGTFANVRIKNKLADGKEGGFTRDFTQSDEGELTTIYEAAQNYAQAKTPLVVFAGADYGMGSSRDWAAKGTAMLGVKAVIAKSFERIHRSNLIGMGVIPFQLIDENFSPTGRESVSIEIPDDLGVKTKLKATLTDPTSGQTTQIDILCRVDTPAELAYLRSGGILPFVLEQLIKA